MHLPPFFQQQMHQLLPPDEFLALSDSLQKEPYLAFRPNQRKAIIPSPSLTPVPWSSLGYYLNQRHPFTFDPLFHAGGYYVQEPSSMFVEQAYRQCHNPQRVLDLCAAPGGKSTLLRSLMPNDTLLVSNEPISSRAHILAENMQKWGHPDIVVTDCYPHQIGKLQGYFDLVLADVPCSGEGMFRKDVPALEEYSAANVRLCAQRARQIITDIWPAIKQGGYLIYSTCTYNTYENEQNVSFICNELGAEPVEIPVRPEWGIKGSLCNDIDMPVYHFMPHSAKGEGFFLALLRKTAAAPSHIKKNKKIPALLPVPSFLKDWVHSPNRMKILSSDTMLYGIPDTWAEDLPLFMQYLHIIHAGIPLAALKAKKYIPHPALPLSLEFQPQAFAAVDIDRLAALTYLRRLSPDLPPHQPNGYLLLTYCRLPIGFVNNLGSRANNLYPQSWKIRSTFTPDDNYDFRIKT